MVAPRLAGTGSWHRAPGAPAMEYAPWPAACRRFIAEILSGNARKIRLAANASGAQITTQATMPRSGDDRVRRKPTPAKAAEEAKSAKAETKRTKVAAKKRVAKK